MLSRLDAALFVLLVVGNGSEWLSGHKRRLIPRLYHRASAGKRIVLKNELLHRPGNRMQALL